MMLPTAHRYQLYCLFSLIGLLFLSNSYGQTPASYPAYVGDIAFDSTQDHRENNPCFDWRVFQYFNDGNGMEFEGEKPAIERSFAAQYKSPLLEGETGLVRIRFLVNCKGQTDRFRIIAMDENYQEKTFAISITDQLLAITQSLKGWKIKKIRGFAVDYYQYLIFKLENGQLKEILP
ncbi:MAG TPA: hypothetical protein PKK69_05705 [Ferruginibacter sp.]|nr:hypothetical protein [Ferruginibacter sp.]